MLELVLSLGLSFIFIICKCFSNLIFLSNVVWLGLCVLSFKNLIVDSKLLFLMWLGKMNQGARPSISRQRGIEQEYCKCMLSLFLQCQFVYVFLWCMFVFFSLSLKACFSFCLLMLHMLLNFLNVMHATIFFLSKCMYAYVFFS